MIFDVRLIAVTIMCLYIQIVQSENVTIDIATAKPYMCDDTLQLKCTYTGPRSCCSDFNRKWTVDEKDLMTNGNLEPFAVGKYEEGEVGGDFFILLIKNLEKADMSEKKYTCQYAFEDMNPTTLDGSCVCVDCCWQCILFALLGLVVGFIIELSVNYKLLSAKDHVRKAIVVGIEGLVISLAAAGSIGYFLCPCLSSIGPIFIPVGFVFGSTLLLVLLYQYKFGDKDAEGLCQLISLGVLTIGIWIVVKKCTNANSCKEGNEDAKFSPDGATERLCLQVENEKK